MLSSLPLSVSYSSATGGSSPLTLSRAPARPVPWSAPATIRMVPWRSRSKRGALGRRSPAACSWNRRSVTVIAVGRSRSPATSSCRSRSVMESSSAAPRVHRPSRASEALQPLAQAPGPGCCVYLGSPNIHSNRAECLALLAQQALDLLPHRRLLGVRLHEGNVRLHDARPLLFEVLDLRGDARPRQLPLIRLLLVPDDLLPLGRHRLQDVQRRGVGMGRVLRDAEPPVLQGQSVAQQGAGHGRPLELPAARLVVPAVEGQRPVLAADQPLRLPAAHQPAQVRR